MDILLPHDKAPMNSFKSTLLIGAAITGPALQAQHSLPDPFMFISFKIRNPVRCIRRRGEEMDLSFSDAKGSGDKILSDLHILNLTVPDRDIIFPEITVTDFQESPVAPAAVRQIFPRAALAHRSPCFKAPLEGFFYDEAADEAARSCHQNPLHVFA